MKKQKFTIKEFNKFYPNDDVCLEYIYNLRYKNFKVCPDCGYDFAFHKVSNRKCYACANCGFQIHPLANTIFHKSSTPLKDWFYCIYLFSISKNGVSGKEIERHLGCTYKTAWRIANRIRSLLKDNSNPLENIVEMDETYFGGKESNKHFNKKTPNTQGRSIKTKTPILGAVERKGNIKAKVVIDTKTNTIHKFARDNIKINSTLNTDEYRGYNNINKQGYQHQVVNHGIKQYVKDDSYTNTIEGFWSQLKRSINGTYHMVSKKYLQNYVDEFSFRYNLRKETKADFFFILPLIGLPYQED